MITSYILILCLSAGFFTFITAVVGKRFSRLLKRPAHGFAGLALIVPILVFMVVVAASPSLLVAAILLLIAATLRPHDTLPTSARFGLPLVAALLAFASTTAPALLHLPPIALQVAAILLTAALIFSANQLPETILTAGPGIALSFLPLAFAPLLGVPSFLALDSALVLSSLLAAFLMADRLSNLTLARQPLTVILGWLIAQAAFHGAWPLALASLLLYAGFLAYGMSRTHPQDVTRAF